MLPIVVAVAGATVAAKSSASFDGDGHYGDDDDGAVEHTSGVYYAYYDNPVVAFSRKGSVDVGGRRLWMIGVCTAEIERTPFH